MGIVETDHEVRRALVLWLSRVSDYDCWGSFSGASQALRRLRGDNPDLVLYNRGLQDVPGGEFVEKLRQLAPSLPAFGFRIYKESDDIFITLTGVSGGYFFRRRSPTEMLEPIDQGWHEGAPPLEHLDAQIRKYFQDLLRCPPPGRNGFDVTVLTQREQEILKCLSHGLADKEIARVLKISAWTVHEHLKSVFGKLGVHTRTEAVVKYLQK